MQTSSARSDVIVVGGGPVGATLALALMQDQATPLSVTVLEAQPDHVPRNDTRTLALSYGSRLILERVGIWQQLHAPTPIKQIHISQRGHFGQVRFSAEQAGLPALGYVIPHAELQAALHASLLQCGARYVRGARVEAVTPGANEASISYTQDDAPVSEQAGLVALADGGRSLKNIPGIRRNQRDYQQSAVVCLVQTEQPHHYLAYERFTAQGPAALLPSGDRYALVWTTSHEHAAALVALDETHFLAQAHAHFGDRQGRFLSATKRASFALLQHRSQPVALPHLALIGNAAQVLHPVAGQGFNMGLRDAWELAQVTRASSPDQIGDAAMLSRYSAGRRIDTQGGLMFTDLLVRGFASSFPGLAAARGLALSALALMPPAKSFLLRRMVFGAQA